jgi:MarR family transcriptional regulator for hemolysin
MEKDISGLTCMPLGRLLGGITKKYFGALSKKLEHHGVDRHFSILVVLDKSSEKCTQQFLSDYLQVDKVTMVRMLDYLVEKGMISRQVNPDDRREHVIKLTPKASKVLPEIAKGISEMNRIAFGGYSKAEQETFWKMIMRMDLNLQNLPANKVDIKLKKGK